MSDTIILEQQFLPNSESFIWKRQYADIQFQLASQDPIVVYTGQTQGKDQTMMDALSNTSDRVQGVYEGGLKTWECSLDLAFYLSQKNTENKAWFKNKNILEVRLFLLS